MDVVVIHWAGYPDDADALLVGKRIDGVVNAVVRVVVVFVVLDDDARSIGIAVVERHLSVRRFRNENPVPVVRDLCLEVERTVHDDGRRNVDLHHVTSECVLDVCLARLNLEWVIKISRV